MAINLYSKASVDSLLSPKLSISSLTNAAATTLNATAPTTNQVLSFDGTQLKWATPAGGATWGSITGTLSSQSDLNTALNARVSTAGDTMDNNAILEFNDTYTSGSLGLTGNAVTLTATPIAPGESAVLNYNQLVLTDSVGAMQVNPTGLTFPDSTVQSTAYTGGGTFVGDRLSIYAGYLYNEQTASNVTTLTLSGASTTMQAKNFTLQSGSGGVITFSDATTQSTAAIGIPTAGTTDQILKKNSGTNYDVAWANASGCDVQTFGSSSSSGTFTWTKPAGAKIVDIYLWAGGAGGGSGARQATSVERVGGSGGGHAGIFYGRINASFLGATETVVVGAGGAGGAANVVNSTFGTTGTAGGQSSFSLFKSIGATAGFGGQTNPTAGGTGRSGIYFFASLAASTAGTGTNTTGGNAGSPTIPTNAQPTGGGGGAGAAASVTTSTAGGSGGALNLSTTVNGIISTIAAGAGGTTAGVAATAGTSATTQYYQGGTGGGGGFYRTGQAGGTGGNGGWPGGGGGGGGASDNGFASGAGGAGANGFAVIITYY